MAATIQITTAIILLRTYAPIEHNPALIPNEIMLMRSNIFSFRNTFRYVLYNSCIFPSKTHNGSKIARYSRLNLYCGSHILKTNLTGTYKTKIAHSK